MNNIILTLKLINNIGNGTILKIIKDMEYVPNDEKELYQLIRERADKDKKIKIPTLEEIKNASFNANNIIFKSEEKNIRYVDILDEAFPKTLKEISSAPTILFYKGDYNCIIDDESIAIVGTRNPTKHGEKIAHRLGYLFAEQGYVINSGLALGCDKYAHQGCLDADGRTVAVLGTPLDKINPSQNEKLADEILAKNGCLITENYIGEKTSRYSFVNRNRIQSGLSLGTIIVETDINGGTMETAKFTMNQGKVLAVYSHPDKYSNEKVISGNQSLMQNSEVISISNKNDIEKFKYYIKELKDKSKSSRQIGFNNL